MQAERAELNHFTTPKGNILWGAALSLAWKELISNIVKNDIQLAHNDVLAAKIVNNFNRAPVSKADLNPQSFYATSGYGNATVHRINKEVKAKFPEKTTDDIKPNIPDDGIIAYAYFLKDLKFPKPFTKSKVMFKGEKVDGFHAGSTDLRKQVVVCSYKNRDNFIARLLTKKKEQEIFLIKSEQKMTPQQATQWVLQAEKGSPLDKDDKFEMPKIELSQKRSVDELVNKFLANQGFTQYYFSQVYEIVKLNVDETGVKVENQGVVVMARCAVVKKKQPKMIILDKPFWIVMREKGKHPYFVAYVNELIQK